MLPVIRLLCGAEVWLGAETELFAAEDFTAGPCLTTDLFMLPNRRRRGMKNMAQELFMYVT